MPFAIKIRGDWFVADKMPAERFGEPMERGLNIPADTPVWSELRTTALLGIVGDEEKCVDLSATVVGAALAMRTVNQSSKRKS